MRRQKSFIQAHQRLLTTLDPNAGWLLLQVQLASHYPRRHAGNGGIIRLSYAEIASLARTSKGAVHYVLERLVTGGWIEFTEGGGRAKSIIRCLLQPEADTPIHRLSEREEQAGAAISDEQWQRLKAHYHNRCLACGARENDGATLSLDHIVPLANRGSNSIHNVQPLCRPCNSRKGARTVDYRANLHAQMDRGVKPTRLGDLLRQPQPPSGTSSNEQQEEMPTLVSGWHGYQPE